jgi:hypothetical protein
MEQVRVYHMTLSTRGYSLGQNAWSYEAYFTAALRGDIHKVREELRAVGIPYFQDLIQERYGQHIPLDKIRGEFEREEQALAPSPDIRIEPLEISYRGRMHHATKLPTLTLSSDIVSYDPELDLDESDTDDSEDFEEADEDHGWEDDDLDEEGEDDEEYDDE